MYPLKVCFAASEISPFAKIGGLGDYSAGLPRFLSQKGHDVRPFMPFYDTIDTGERHFHAVDFIRDVPVRLADETVLFTLITAQLPNSSLDVYFIDCPRFFHRGNVYTNDRDEYLRFGFFCRAVIESCQRLGWGPDIFHCNDWHTALLPLLYQNEYKWDSLFHRSKSVLTMHNHGYGYQGLFPTHAIWKLGIKDYANLIPREDRESDIVNFLKIGILHADAVVPVSLTYADEIRTPELGHGLDAMLRYKGDAVTGIVNGADYGEWDPRRDPFIPYHYSADNLEWKEENKKYLLNDVGLPYDPDAPVLGVVSRLTEQKGLDLLFECLHEILYHNNVRFIILGGGERHYENFFEAIQYEFPHKAYFYRGYNNRLSHLIQAGSDMLIVPSKYEPCGLTQIYALKYGAVPVVRKTGGLADTVQPHNHGYQNGVGFVFDHFTSVGLSWAINFAIHTFPYKHVWKPLMKRGMEQDFSWDSQGEKYLDLYRRIR
ncbi:MAG: hypothetical protein B6244_10430 [Candidatus Cloacimonetes bacterium 4572_55]|nr:MAG: hypothetical protein B6244_10430 [Candidatus Cloacimonetes bacterium 4572_55]